MRYAILASLALLASCAPPRHYTPFEMSQRSSKALCAVYARGDKGSPNYGSPQIQEVLAARGITNCGEYLLEQERIELKLDPNKYDREAAERREWLERDERDKDRRAFVEAAKARAEASDGRRRCSTEQRGEETITRCR